MTTNVIKKILFAFSTPVHPKVIIHNNNGFDVIFKVMRGLGLVQPGGTAVSHGRRHCISDSHGGFFRFLQSLMLFILFCRFF
jgi:hypothetical protein